MNMNDFDTQFFRTLSIVKQLATGKFLSLPESRRIGMGENMEIGYLIRLAGEEDRVVGELTLKDLNDICEKHGIGFVIPEVK